MTNYLHVLVLIFVLIQGVFSSDNSGHFDLIDEVLNGMSVMSIQLQGKHEESQPGSTTIENINTNIDTSINPINTNIDVININTNPTDINTDPTVTNNNLTVTGPTDTNTTPTVTNPGATVTKLETWKEEEEEKLFLKKAAEELKKKEEQERLEKEEEERLKKEAEAEFKRKKESTELENEEELENQKAEEVENTEEEKCAMCLEKFNDTRIKDSLEQDNRCPICRTVARKKQIEKWMIPHFDDMNRWTIEIKYETLILDDALYIAQRINLDTYMGVTHLRMTNNNIDRYGFIAILNSILDSSIEIFTFKDNNHWFHLPNSIIYSSKTTNTSLQDMDVSDIPEPFIPILNEYLQYFDGLKRIKIGYGTVWETFTIHESSETFTLYGCIKKLRRISKHF